MATLTNLDMRLMLREEGGASFIAALARSFPCLEMIEKSLPLDPWAPWDLRAAAFGRSHGQQCAIRFVLSVWNSGTDWDNREHLEEWWGEQSAESKRAWKKWKEDDFDLREAKLGRFELFDALGVWDDGNRAAFLEWAKNPIWP